LRDDFLLAIFVAIMHSWTTATVKRPNGGIAHMKKKKLDVSRKLDTPEQQGAYIGRAATPGHAPTIRNAVGVVARKRGMTHIASTTNLNRESLYRALGDQGNPEFATMLKVMKALGLKLSVASFASTAKAKAEKKRSA